MTIVRLNQLPNDEANFLPYSLLSGGRPHTIDVPNEDPLTVLYLPDHVLQTIWLFLAPPDYVTFVPSIVLSAPFKLQVFSLNESLISCRGHWKLAFSLPGLGKDDRPDD